MIGRIVGIEGIHQAAFVGDGLFGAVRARITSRAESGNHRPARPRPAGKNATTPSNSSQSLASPSQQPAACAIARCAGRDRRCRGMRLDVGTVVAGAHVDAALRHARLDRRGAVGIGFGGIESGGIVGGKIDQREIERGAGGMLRMARDIAQAKQFALAERRIVAPLGRRLAGRSATTSPCRRGARRPIAVEHLQRQFLRREFLLDRLQRAARPRASPRIRRRRSPRAAGR